MEEIENQTKTIREYSAHNKLWMYVKLTHNLNLDHEGLENLVKAVDQYKKDIVNGMSTKPVESY